MTIFCYLLLVLALACKVYWAVNLVLSAPKTHTTGRPARVAVLKIENHCSPNGSMTPVLYSPNNELTVGQLHALAIKLVDNDNLRASEFKRSLETWANDDSRSSERLQVPEQLCNLREIYCVKVVLKKPFLHPNWKRDGITVCKVTNRKKATASHIAWNTKEAQALYRGQRNELASTN